MTFIGPRREINEANHLVLVLKNKRYKNTPVCSMSKQMKRLTSVLQKNRRNPDITMFYMKSGTVGIYNIVFF